MISLQSDDNNLVDLFRALPGLPATGPWPEQFSASGRGTHREGFVVEFNPGTSASWVGNFQPGGTGYDDVLLHHDGHSVIVIAHGEAYWIDPDTRALLGSFGGDVYGSFRLRTPDAIVWNFGIRLEARNAKGTLWKTRRISWDGIEELRESDGMLHGTAWDAVNDCMVPFSVAIDTGTVTGGAYPAYLPDWE